MQTIAWSSKELVEQYKDLSSGHFFDKGTMRFFNSRVTGNYKRVSDTVAYFITTEKDLNLPRYATIRKAEIVRYIRESDGRECQKILIDTVGDFNTISLAKAKRMLKNME